MRKFIIYILGIMVCSNTNSQIIKNNFEPDDTLQIIKSISSSEIPTDIGVPKIIHPSPQSMIFEKFVDHKVTEYNGLPDITIPLAEISLKGLTIPIALTYHASGIKYMQFDGDVGAGWTLNVGGYRITRTVYGKSDFEGRQRYNEAEFEAKIAADNKFEIDRYLGRMALRHARGDLGQIMAGLSDSEYMDAEYDQFVFNTPTSNGHFIYLGPSNCRILEKTNEKLIMTRTDGRIIDDKGNIFSFGGTDTQGRLLNETAIVDSQPVETAWPLSTIATPYDESVTFKYKLYDQISSRTARGIYALDIDDATMCSFFVRTPTDTDIPQGNLDSKSTQKNSGDEFSAPTSCYYIDRIETPDMIIEIGRTELDRALKNTPCLINSIEIKDKTGVCIKKIIFSYKTFPEQSTDKPWHHLLTSVKFTSQNQEIEKEYKFEYNEYDNAMQYYYPDQWGYYKKGTSVKTLNLHRESLTDSYISWAAMFRGTYGRSTLDAAGSQYGNLYFSDRIVSSNTDLFSLKKIIYPTGGYSEYIYESNQYESYKGGGLRVKAIKTADTESSIPIISIYKYANGIPSFNLNKDNFTSLTYIMNVVSMTAGIPYDYLTFYAKKTYSMQPTGDIPISDFRVSYPDVTVENCMVTGTDTIKEGKTVFKFTIPVRYQTQPMMNSSSFINPLSMLRLTTSDMNPGNSTTNVSEYALGYSPQLLSKEIYHKNNNVIHKEEYSYRDVGSDIFKSLKISKKVYFELHRTPAELYSSRSTGTSFDQPLLGFSFNPGTHPDLPYYAYNFLNSFFTYMPYTIKTGRLIPITKTTTIYDNSGSNPVVTLENYEYDDKYRVQKVTQGSSIGTNIEKSYIYPPASSRFQILNMLSTVVEIVNKDNGSEISRVKNVYPSDNDILPMAMQSSSSGESNLRTDITYDRYDSKGNILQMTHPNGLKVSYLWSYNYQYPIAEITNASYDDVQTQLRSLGIANPENLAVESNPAESTFGVLKNLRNNLPHAQIKVFRYKPLVGITEETDPQGISTYYEYDVFGRLIEVYIKENNVKQIIESYQYNYR